MGRIRLMASIVTLAMTGCSEPVPPEPEPVFEEVLIRDMTAVDMLFVVDNSSSTAEEQAILTEQAEGLLRELIAPSGPSAVAVSSLHLGVVSTDIGKGGWDIGICRNPINGDNGVLQNRDWGILDDCEPTYSAADCGRLECPWLTHSAEYPDDGRDQSNPPIWEDFGCIATLGTEGCGPFEQPLESSNIALTIQAGNGSPNEGFLRDGTLLAVVYVTDEDDCSARDFAFFNPQRDDYGTLNVRCALHPEELYPISRYRDALVELHGDRVVVAAIAGVPIDGSWEPGDPLEELAALQVVDPENPNELLPSCDAEMGVAYPPVRLAELVYSFGDDGVLGSICRTDWSDTLLQIARTIQRHLGTGCVTLPEGVDPAADCRLVEVLDDGTEREVPRASVDGPGGWSVEASSAACPGGQLRLDGEPIAAEGYRFECVAEGRDR